MNLHIYRNAVVLALSIIRILHTGSLVPLLATFLYQTLLPAEVPLLLNVISYTRPDKPHLTVHHSWIGQIPGPPTFEGHLYRTTECLEVAC